MSDFMTPKLTPIPLEFLTIVDNFKESLKTQRELQEQITTDNGPKEIKTIAERISQINVDALTAKNNLQKTSAESKILKDESRQSLRSGETAQRLKESSAYNYEYTVLLNYLHSVASSYERQLVSYAEQVTYFEGVLSGKFSCSASLKDILTHLKRIDEVYKYIAAKVYSVHEAVKDVKEVFLFYRQNVLNDKSNYFNDGIELSSPTKYSRMQNLPPTSRLEGPSPFSEASTGALLAMASALNRSQTSGGSLNFNAGMSTGSSFASLGGFLGQKPANAGLSLFQATTQQPSAAGQLFSTLPSFSGVGTTTSGSSFFTQSASSTVAPFERYSNSINTVSSGTLFGGSATQNIGIVRPTSSIAPLQQTADQSATLSLLKTPLGVKRGKT